MRRWLIKVELTYDWEPKETDNEALLKARKELDELLKKNGVIRHYHILQVPIQCMESD